MPVSITSSDPTLLEEVIAATTSRRDDDALTLERERLADDLLELLTDAQRDAVELRMIGLSYAKVAAMLGISIRSVRVREQRGMARMQAAIALDPTRWQLPQ